MSSFYIELNNNISIANIWINGGTSLDNENHKGINKILCSLLTRGCRNYDKFAFSDHIDSYGAELNCEAFEDGISIFIKSLKQYFNDVYPLIELLLEEPNLYEEEFLLCKKNAIDSINKSKENKFNITFDNWKKITYKDHPYSFSCNGLVNNINIIEHQDILNEYKSLKKREHFLLTNVTRKLSTNIKDIKPLTSKDKDPINSKAVKDNNKNFICHFSNSKQMILILGSETCPHFHNDNLPLKILEAYLSYGMSSKLFKIFREQNGLTYDSGVFFPMRKYNAPFSIYLSVSEENAKIAYKLLISIWQDLQSKLISNNKLLLAKLKLKTSFLHDYQTVEEITSRKVRLLAYGMDPFYDEKAISLIENIRSEDILRVSKSYLKNAFLSISGNEKICEEIRYMWMNKF
tara:strand:- start:3029 stop:4243 length:1215 start_codon:yes stop_codon:yes gene_type:complete